MADDDGQLLVACNVVQGGNTVVVLAGYGVLIICYSPLLFIYINYTRDRLLFLEFIKKNYPQ